MAQVVECLSSKLEYWVYPVLKKKKKKKERKKRKEKEKKKRKTEFSQKKKIEQHSAQFGQGHSTLCSTGLHLPHLQGSHTCLLMSPAWPAVGICIAIPGPV
jgi:hypothetical protein